MVAKLCVKVEKIYIKLHMYQKYITVTTLDVPIPEAEDTC